jgi:hypothetical protein
MSRKGHYLGGSTIIRPWDSSWFGKKVPKWAKRKNRKGSAPKRPLSLAEKAEFDALKKSQETGTRLIVKAKKQPKKKSWRSSGKKQLPAIKPEPSVVNRSVTVVRQAGSRGRSRPVIVEFAPKGRPTETVR